MSVTTMPVTGMPMSENMTTAIWPLPVAGACVPYPIVVTRVMVNRKEFQTLQRSLSRAAERNESTVRREPSKGAAAAAAAREQRPLRPPNGWGA